MEYLHGEQIMDDRTPSRKGTPPPLKTKKTVTDRSNLSPQHIQLLIESARSVGRCGLRDSTLILMTYRHALRVGEVISLTWNQISLENNQLQVKRLKGGSPSIHKMQTDEMSWLMQLRQRKPNSDIVFVSERNGSLTRRAVHNIIARAAKTAGIPFHVHPYMLRHARGYELGAEGLSVKDIQEYLGHRNVQHSIGYASDLNARVDAEDYAVSDLQS